MSTWGCCIDSLYIIMNLIVNEDEEDVEVNEEGGPVIKSGKFTSLKDFYSMYSAIKSKFGWCGPAFVRPQIFFNSKERQLKNPTLLQHVYQSLKA
jgi:hypothetical protein